MDIQKIDTNLDCLYNMQMAQYRMMSDWAMFQSSEQGILILKSLTPKQRDNFFKEWCENWISYFGKHNEQ